MKKLLSIILAFAMVLSVATAVSAQDADVKVKFNGEIMEFDVNPIIENDRTLVPFRAIFEALGCNVFYRPAEGGALVIAKKADDTLTLRIGADHMVYQDKEIPLDAPAKIVNDRTLVPLRAVSEAFDALVEWEADTRTALVSSKPGDFKVTTKVVEDKIVAEDGVTIVELMATYPELANGENDEFITTINSLASEFAAGFLYADDTLEATANELYKKYGGDAMPMELSTSYTIDTNKNGILSITNHTRTEMIDTVRYDKESIVWDMNAKKKMELTDILQGDLDEHINQTVYDAFVAYYEENYADKFDAKVAEKLGAELNNVRFYLKDDALVLYFNPGQIIEGTQKVQAVEIPYKEGFFKIKLDEKKNVINPLPAAISMENLDDCTINVALKEGDAYVNDAGAMQMKVEVYGYDLYDMVDVAALKEGDYMLRLGEEVKIEKIERTETGRVIINEGIEKNGFELYTTDNTVYYESGFNDAKAFYLLGIAEIPVSTEFVYNDQSDLDAEATQYYPGDFLTDEAGIKYEFTPYNTTLLIKDGYAMEMTKHYQP